MQDFDVMVVGAGAAGMMCAAVAGQLGLKVALLDHAERIGEKIRISGGGRCNFTNLGTSFENFLGENPRFARFALNEYSPRDFAGLLQSYGVGFHEKHRGQLFCDESAEQVIEVLKQECGKGGVRWLQPVSLEAVSFEQGRYLLATSAGAFRAMKLVVATGGLSIPKIGASDLGYRIARQFGLRIVDTRPALVPLTFNVVDWQNLVSLAGVALPVRIAVEEAKDKAKSKKRRPAFDEDLLFTHRGLSGPGVLQISSYWQPGESLTLNLLPSTNLADELIQAKGSDKRQLDNILSALMPRRVVEAWLAIEAQENAGQANAGLENGGLANKKLAEIADKALRELSERIHRWSVVPNGTEGYKKAEVTRGGVATDELDQKSLQAKQQAGLHFIGEVVDITGWLGGYNFQWAWASAQACARAIAAAKAGENEKPSLRK